MQIRPKSPHELAAQYVDMHQPLHGDGIVGLDKLNDQFRTGRDEIVGLIASGASDTELAGHIDALHGEARRTGLYRLSEGEGADERLESLKDSYGDKYSEEFIASLSAKNLATRGLTRNVKWGRLASESAFTRPVRKFLEGHELDEEAEQERIAALRERIVDTTDLTPEMRERIANDFPNGDFLFHSAKAPELVAILDSGELLNYKAIHDRETAAAEREGRDKEFMRRNSGYEGISWSLNGIDALPADRFHVAGFLAAPRTVLMPDEQLAVPSRPAPFEVLQVTGEIDASEYYDLKSQQELFGTVNAFGEANSVYSNLVFLNVALKSFMKGHFPGEQKFLDKPQLLKFIENNTDEQIAEVVADKYKKREDGSVEFSTELLQQVDDGIPVGAVWLQALIDSGEIDEFETFKGSKTVRDVIERVDGKNIWELIGRAKGEMEYIDGMGTVMDEKVDEVSVSVEDMYLVVSKKDVNTWLKILARTDHTPRGILVYDNRRVRLENFASKFNGDHEALTDEIRKAIPAEAGTIDWEEQIFGYQISDEMRTGYRSQVIAEKFLDRRKSIRKKDGTLVVA